MGNTNLKITKTSNSTSFIVLYNISKHKKAVKNGILCFCKIPVNYDVIQHM